MNKKWNKLSDIDHTLKVLDIAMDLGATKREFGQGAMVQKILQYCDDGYIQKCSIKNGKLIIRLPKELGSIIKSQSIA